MGFTNTLFHYFDLYKQVYYGYNRCKKICMITHRKDIYMIGLGRPPK